MILEAYELIRDILDDEALNTHVLQSTGKRLAFIDSGPRTSTPSVAVTLNGGDLTRADNTVQGIDYTVVFLLPSWDRDGARKCHAFLGAVIDACFSHERRSGSGRRSFVMKLNPTVVEEDPESDQWQVILRVTVAVFR